jgi:hypothetical protein
MDYHFRAMQDKRERWMQLAEMAASEQDPEKLSKLVTEIDKLLAEKQERLRSGPPKPLK